VYFEAKSKGDRSTRFDLQFYYTAYTFYRKIDIPKIRKPDIESQVYRQYTKEEPHAAFTEKISELSKSITGQEENPYLKGKKIYEWICSNIKYSYAAEYSTIRNMSSYTLDRRYGDCGQEALLFITLCRISGIPARWQSGFLTFPGKQITHDWAEIYIEPYGWLPVDPYMGIYFTSVTEDLSSAERNEIRDFYYGNIDYYRMVANKGHGQQLNPAKHYFRSDNVDFQRGEIETAERNLYFNEWKFSFNCE
jgi:TPR repeat protein